MPTGPFDVLDLEDGEDSLAISTAPSRPRPQSASWIFLKHGFLLGSAFAYNLLTVFLHFRSANDFLWHAGWTETPLTKLPGYRWILPTCLLIALNVPLFFSNQRIMPSKIEQLLTTDPNKVDDWLDCRGNCFGRIYINCETIYSAIWKSAIALTSFFALLNTFGFWLAIICTIPAFFGTAFAQFAMFFENSSHESIFAGLHPTLAQLLGRALGLFYAFAVAALYFNQFDAVFLHLKWVTDERLIERENGKALGLLIFAVVMSVLFLAATTAQFSQKIIKIFDGPKQPKADDSNQTEARLSDPAATHQQERECVFNDNIIYRLLYRLTALGASAAVWKFIVTSLILPSFAPNADWRNVAFGITLVLALGNLITQLAIYREKRPEGKPAPTSWGNIVNFFCPGCSADRASSADLDYIPPSAMQATNGSYD